MNSTVGGAETAAPRVTGAVPVQAQVSLAKQPQPAAMPVLQVTPSAGPFYAPGIGATVPSKKVNLLVAYWRKVGGGSLALSLLIHVGILVAAFFIVETITQEAKVDFLPGGGSKAGQDASAQLAQTKQNKRKNALNKSMPKAKIVSTSTNAAIALPDAPLDNIEISDMSSLMGGQMGAGGMGTKGMGGGFGSGNGIGGMKGFTGMTFFGRAGDTEGLPGSFYDMKQDRDRKPLPYSGSFPEYALNIEKAAQKRFSPSSLKDYYKANQEVSFTYLLVPANLPAAEGPKCFNAEKEVEPRGWFVHYTGMVTPPKSGTYRFVGFFDDLLIVYINNKPVLDGSWVPMAGQGERERDPEIRQEFKGPSISGARTAYFGKWIKMNEPFKLDIVVGETPGGLVGGLLMVQNKDEKYEPRADGTPILPLFTTTKLEIPDL
ncbi:MAG TPA: PA14 domain-containing protein, partial [Verrucomicrobium sp.]|nr:PA14 domain-containing protein [Verrucomicrobium sp.]